MCDEKIMLCIIYVIFSVCLGIRFSKSIICTWMISVHGKTW